GLRAGARGPEPTLAPEQFAVGGGEAGRVEHAEALRLFGLCAQPQLDGIRPRSREHRRRIDVKRRQRVSDNRGIVDAASVREFRAEERTAKLFAPCLIEGNERHSRREQIVLRKRIWTAEREPKVRARALEIAPHIASLGRIEIERRGGPPCAWKIAPSRKGR